MPTVGAITAVAALGYSVYNGVSAQEQAKKNLQQQKAEFDQQQQQQQQQFQQQQQDAQALAAKNIAQEQQTQQQIQSIQQTAQQNEAAQIPINTATLQGSLAATNAQQMKAQEPFLEDRLNQLGLLSSGALPAQQAIQQANLEAQAQQQVANYQIGANQQLTQNQNAASVANAQNAYQNSLLNINTNEQNLAQQYASQNAMDQNNAAYQQYLGTLGSANAAAQQQTSNAVLGFSGQLGLGAYSAYNQRNTPSISDQITYANQYSPSAINNQINNGTYPYSANALSYQAAANAYNPSLAALQSNTYGPYSSPGAYQVPTSPYSMSFSY